MTGAKKVHSLIDKVYKRKNLEMAWEKVKENRGGGGIDGQSLEAFEAFVRCSPLSEISTIDATSVLRFHRSHR
jgi:hypothetical protein